MKRRGEPSPNVEIKKREHTWLVHSRSPEGEELELEQEQETEQELGRMRGGLGCRHSPHRELSIWNRKRHAGRPGNSKNAVIRRYRYTGIR